MKISIEVERENDGRWIAEVPELPGVMVYACTEMEALQRVKSLALRCIADRLDNGEFIPGLDHITFTPPAHASVAVC